MIRVSFDDKKKLFSFWIDSDLLEGLKALSVRDNRSVSSIIRDAIFTELINNGIDFY